MTTTPVRPNAKAIWIASMPRSGSMWAFNVARSLVRAAGCQVVPERIPQSDKEMIRMVELCLLDPDPSKVAVVKIHTRLRAPPPRSRFITTHRDPRDALVSWTRFMRRDFDAGLSAMTGSVATCDHYRGFPANLMLHLKYADIKDRPVYVIRGIADFLGLTPPQDEVNDIHERFRKENVVKLINATEADISERLAKGEHVAKDEIVKLDSQYMRAFDTSSGFQSGHVSGYRDGEWRKLFSAEEKGRIEEILGDWLARNGYPPE